MDERADVVASDEFRLAYEPPPVPVALPQTISVRAIVVVLCGIFAILSTVLIFTPWAFAAKPELYSLDFAWAISIRAAICLAIIGVIGALVARDFGVRLLFFMAAPGSWLCFNAVIWGFISY